MWASGFIWKMVSRGGDAQALTVQRPESAHFTVCFNVFRGEKPNHRGDGCTGEVLKFRLRSGILTREGPGRVDPQVTEAE